jgi:hypothetical protein
MRGFVKTDLTAQIGTVGSLGQAGKGIYGYLAAQLRFAEHELPRIGVQMSLNDPKSELRAAGHRFES